MERENAIRRHPCAEASSPAPTASTVLDPPAMPSLVVPTTATAVAAQVEGVMNWLPLPSDWHVCPVDSQFKAIMKVTVMDSTWQTTSIGNVVIRWHDNGEGGNGNVITINT